MILHHHNNSPSYYNFLRCPRHAEETKTKENVLIHFVVLFQEETVKKYNKTISHYTQTTKKNVMSTLSLPRSLNGEILQFSFSKNRVTPPPHPDSVLL